MKKIITCIITLFLLAAPVSAEELIPVGQVIGLELGCSYLSIADFEEDSAAKAGGLQVGDRLLTIDGKAVTSLTDIRQALNCSKGSVSVTVQRAGKEKTLRIHPAITPNGPKLGVYLQQSITGVGTVTYFDPDSRTFAALGHGVSTKDGQLAEMVEGNAFAARVASVRKGQSGQPGQLVGQVEDKSPLGQLMCNTARGVFGKTEAGWQGKALPIGESSQIRTGKATILSTVRDSTVREYSVEILKIYPKANQTGRNLLLRVTDPALLEATGGIVQGMSGSPIIQDGKLIGAVTHVLVNDPTTGYGIFIENMLDAAA